MEFLKERQRLERELEDKKRRLCSLIEEDPQSVGRALVCLGRFHEGIHKNAWRLFLALPVNEKMRALKQKEFDGCHWQTLMSFSPFMFDEKWGSKSERQA